jgi:YHS domain-containing protein
MSNQRLCFKLMFSNALVIQSPLKIVSCSLRPYALPSILRTGDAHGDDPTRRLIMERDPVCGISLEAGHALRMNYHGKAYYFCSHDCRVNFEDRPDEYAHPAHHLLGTIVTYPLEVLAKAIQANETAH